MNSDPPVFPEGASWLFVWDSSDRVGLHICARDASGDIWEWKDGEFRLIYDSFDAWVLQQKGRLEPAEHYTDYRWEMYV